jgi:clan AA aspartic protease
MPVWPGRFNGKHPVISLVVAGTQGHPEQFDAVVDTGFSGFLMMSAEAAAQHGFSSGPSTTGTMADGSRVALPTALATVGFANRTHLGVVTLAPTAVVSLVGIDFLRAFKLALVMTNEQIWLMDESEFEKIALNSGARQLNVGPAQTPNG